MIKRHGGLWFIAIGRLRISLCVARRVDDNRYRIAVWTYLAIRRAVAEHYRWTEWLP